MPCEKAREGGRKSGERQIKKDKEDEPRGKLGGERENKDDKQRNRRRDRENDREEKKKEQDNYPTTSFAGSTGRSACFLFGNQKTHECLRTGKREVVAQEAHFHCGVGPLHGSTQGARIH